MANTSFRRLTADQQIARNRLKRRDGYVPDQLVFGALSDIEMLEIHAANCCGLKGTWNDRIAWKGITAVS